MPAQAAARRGEVEHSGCADASSYRSISAWITRDVLAVTVKSRQHQRFIFARVRDCQLRSLQEKYAGCFAWHIQRRIDAFQ